MDKHEVIIKALLNLKKRVFAKELVSEVQKLDAKYTETEIKANVIALVNAGLLDFKEDFSVALRQEVFDKSKKL